MRSEDLPQSSWEGLPGPCRPASPDGSICVNWAGQGHMYAQETPAEALARLLGELTEHRKKNGRAHVQHYTEALPEVEARLREVPLVHGTDLKGFLGALRENALCPRTELGKAPHLGEDYFGLRDVVYTSAGILYPDRDFAFVLSPCIESGKRVNASPCDTGSLYASLCPHLAKAPDPARMNLYLATTLPAPEYREYLIHYVATCFESAVDFLGLESHKFADPHRVLSERWTSRVFEVRFKGRVPLETWGVHEVFLPRDGGRDALEARSRLEPFRQNGVKVHMYAGSRERLQGVVWRSLISLLGERGRR